jgi:predicted short-subunit dehydrogenase-like oxidoreductase (DUF2520 family)
MALALLARKARYRVAAIGARSLERAQAAAHAIGADVPSGLPEEVAPLGQLVLLTVSDDAIESLCRDLAEKGAFARGSVVAHCSGALSSSILASARECCGAQVGSMHPLQTFPDVQAGVSRFPGTFCFCEGDEPAATALENLAADLGGRPVRIKTEGKLLYHAAAVLASNCLVGLVDAALATARLAGIGQDDARAALAPLVGATAENVLRLGPAKALTGPVARGDHQLIQRQYAQLRQADVELAEIYRVLSRRIVQVALEKGTIAQAKAQALRDVLQG